MAAPFRIYLQFINPPTVIFSIMSTCLSVYLVRITENLKLPAVTFDRLDLEISIIKGTQLHLCQTWVKVEFKGHESLYIQLVLRLLTYCPVFITITGLNVVGNNINNCFFKYSSRNELHVQRTTMNLCKFAVHVSKAKARPTALSQLQCMVCIAWLSCNIGNIMILKSIKTKNRKKDNHLKPER